MSKYKKVEETVTDFPEKPKPKKDENTVHQIPQYGSKALEDTQVTRQELRSILKAMDKDGFEKIMDEYSQEISNPENVKETNQYLKEMQEKKDIPSNVRLIKPNVGFCLKTKKTIKNLSQKTYINICSFDEVQKPFQDKDSRNMWSVPFLLNKPRNDQDEKSVHVLVYDVVFHPEAIDKANKDINFKKFVCDSAINGINDNLMKDKTEKVSVNYKIVTKFNYKGLEVSFINANVLNKSEFDKVKEPASNYKTGVQKEIEDIKKGNDDEEEERNFDKVDVEEPINEFNPVNNEKKQLAESYEITEKLTKPKFTLKYMDEIELHKYFYDPNNQALKQYTKIIVELNTPLMESLDDNYILDLNSRKIYFKYKEIYEIEIDLPQEIVVEKCSAKYEKSKKILKLILPVVERSIEKEENKNEVLETIYEENNVIVEKNKIQEVHTNKEEEEAQNHKKEEPVKIDEHTGESIQNVDQSNKPNEEKSIKNENQEKNIEKLEIKDGNNNISVESKENNDNNDMKPKIEELGNNDNTNQNIEVKLSNEKLNDLDPDEQIDSKNLNVNEENKIQIHTQDQNKIYYMNFCCELIYEIE